MHNITRSFNLFLSSNLSTRHVVTRLILSTSSCTLTIADCYSEDYDPLSSTQTLRLFTLSIHSLMFIKRTSTAIHCISTDFLNGIVDVMFNNGSVYRYSNVSRRAIANLQLQRNMSLGFWVNNNLLGNKRVKSVQTYAAIPSC